MESTEKRIKEWNKQEGLAKDCKRYFVQDIAKHIIELSREETE
jgi:hypothetical protein